MNTLNIQWLQWMAAGDEPSAWPLLIAWLSALWGAWACAAGLAWVAWKRRPDRLYLAVVAAGAILASLLSHAIAAHFNVPRPFVAGWVPAYISHRASAATPSTHATVMFFVAFALMSRATLRRPGSLVLAMALVVGWARIYVGVHFPLDILAGIAIAALQAGLLMLAWKHFRPATPGAGVAARSAGPAGIGIHGVGLIRTQRSTADFTKSHRIRCATDDLQQEFPSRHFGRSLKRQRWNWTAPTGRFSTSSSARAASP